MTITFTITDGNAAKFLDAARWKQNKPTGGTDSVIQNLQLRTYIGALIEEHKKFVAVNTLESSVNSLQSQLQATERQLQTDREALMLLKQQYDQNNVPVEV